MRIHPIAPVALVVFAGLAGPTALASASVEDATSFTPVATVPYKVTSGVVAANGSMYVQGSRDGVPLLQLVHADGRVEDVSLPGRTGDLKLSAAGGVVFALESGTPDRVWRIDGTHGTIVMTPRYPADGIAADSATSVFVGTTQPGTPASFNYPFVGVQQWKDGAVQGPTTLGTTHMPARGVWAKDGVPFVVGWSMGHLDYPTVYRLDGATWSSTPTEAYEPYWTMKSANDYTTWGVNRPQWGNPNPFVIAGSCHHVVNNDNQRDCIAPVDPVTSAEQLADGRVILTTAKDIFLVDRNGAAPRPFPVPVPAGASHVWPEPTGTNLWTVVAGDTLSTIERGNLGPTSTDTPTPTPTPTPTTPTPTPTPTPTSTPTEPTPTPTSTPTLTPTEPTPTSTEPTPTSTPTAPTPTPTGSSGPVSPQPLALAIPAVVTLRAGQPADLALRATGGTPAYSFASDTRMEGLVLTRDGHLTGTPVHPRTYPHVVVSVTDAAGATATTVVRLEVRPAVAR